MVNRNIIVTVGDGNTISCFRSGNLNFGTVDDFIYDVFAAIQTGLAVACSGESAAALSACIRCAGCLFLHQCQRIVTGCVFCLFVQTECKGLACNSRSVLCISLVHGNTVIRTSGSIVSAEVIICGAGCILDCNGCFHFFQRCRICNQSERSCLSEAACHSCPGDRCCTDRFCTERNLCRIACCTVKCNLIIGCDTDSGAIGCSRCCIKSVSVPDDGAVITGNRILCHQFIGTEILCCIRIVQICRVGRIFIQIRKLCSCLS